MQADLGLRVYASLWASIDAMFPESASSARHYEQVVRPHFRAEGQVLSLFHLWSRTDLGRRDTTPYLQMGLELDDQEALLGLHACLL